MTNSQPTPDVKSTIKLAVYQGQCSDDIDQNLKRAYAVMEEAWAVGCDFLCFPETYLSNYKREYALALDDARVQALIAYTARFDMVVIIGLSEQVGAIGAELKVFNTMLVIYQGRLLGKYRKTMLTNYD